jgi:hypothetical protein
VARKSIQLSALLILLLLTGCPLTPTPTPTATSAPTPTTVPYAERSSHLERIMRLVVNSSDCDPTTEVLHKYLNGLSIDLTQTTLTVVEPGTIESYEDFRDLAIETIGLAALVSNAGRNGDWYLEKIEMKALRSEDYART